MAPGWSLAAGELRIPYGTGIAAHRMVLMIDPGGRMVRQINGLASWFDTGKGVWRHKPIGYLPSDRLRGYDTLKTPSTWMPVNGIGPASLDARDALTRGDVQVLAGGLSEEGLARRLAPALDALRRINALTPGPEGGSGLPYPFLGFGRNSNSFYNTMLKAMGLAEPAFATRVWLAPGRDELLLPEDTLSARSPLEGEAGV